MYAANDETATMMTPIATIATNTYAARELRSLPTKECFCGSDSTCSSPAYRKAHCGDNEVNHGIRLRKSVPSGNASHARIDRQFARGRRENGAYRGHSAAGAAEHVIAADPDADSGMIALFLDGDFGVADAASAAMRRARS